MVILGPSRIDGELVLLQEGVMKWSVVGAEGVVVAEGVIVAGEGVVVVEWLLNG